MEKWSKHIIYILVAMLLASCTAEERNVPEPPVANSDDVTIQIEFPAEAQGLSTKAVNENGIDSLEILVFTPPTPGAAASTADVFAYRITKRGGDIQNTADDNKKKVAVTLKRNKEQRIILLANAPNAVVTWLNANLTEGTTRLSQILPNLTYSGSPWGVDHLTKGNTSFPMWGQENSHSTIPATGSPTPKTIKMIRAVSRISVKGDDSDPSLGFGTTYTLDSIYVCNAVPNGYVSPLSTELHLEQVTKPNQNTTGARLDLGYAPTDGIYVPECDSTIGGNTPSFIVIKSRFDDGTGMKPYYYKIDLKSAGKSVPLLRNHSYTILIKQILSRGYATFIEARNADATNSGIRYTVVIGSHTGDANEVRIDHITYNDFYMLGSEAQGIKIDWMAYTTGTPYKLPVLTTYDGGWTAAVVEGSSWLSLGTLKSGAANAINYVDLVATRNSTLDSRKALIHITAGTLVLPVEITQIIGSNSYIITGAGNQTLQIPVNSANLGGARVSSSTTGLKLKVLWQEGANVDFTVPSAEVAGDAVFTVSKTGSGTSGNAVIALMSGGGGPGMVGGLPGDEVLWSWHVWLTPSVSDIKTYNGYLFMDRNLGAASTSVSSVYYQWGRKDPFFNDGTNKSYTIEAVSGTNNLPGAIKNPAVFYTATTSPYDWIGTASVNTLWVDINDEKGAYDPCPFGWRVPTTDAYTSFTNGKNAISIPIVGGISRANGNLSTSNGHVWTTSVVGFQARGMRFASLSAAGTLFSEYRAQAYPVRCVKDVKK